MNENAPVRMAVWGIGYHALKNVLPAINESSAVTLTGVYSRNRKQAQDAAQKWEVVSWSTFQALLDSPEVDAVYLCTPIGLHHEHGSAIVRAGKHLLCEKALTDSAERSLALIQEARRNNVVLCEAFMYLFHPQFHSLIELVNSDEFGRMETLNCWFGMPTLDSPGFRNSRALGGGAFLDVGCYPISFAGQVIAGQPRVISASVDPHSDDEVDLSGHATLEFSTGEIAHLEWGFGRSYRNEAFIWGQGKSVCVDRIFSKTPTYESSLLVREQRGEENRIKVKSANAFVEMLAEFSRAISDEQLREKLFATAIRQAKLMGAVENAIHDHASRDRRRTGGERVKTMTGGLDHVDVRGSLSVGTNVNIDTNVIVKGTVTLGNSVTVEPNCILEDVSVGEGTNIRANSIVESAEIGRDCLVGPYARVRPGSHVGDGAQIGNFVEIKESRVGPGSKINHHAYIGNATIGPDVVIGAGTITCNFDGERTQATRIGEGAFIGSGCQLVAPIEIGAGAVVGAGSTVTEDAPARRLTLARQRQVTIEGWKRNKRRADSEQP